MRAERPVLDLEPYRPFLSSFSSWIDSRSAAATKNWCGRLGSTDSSQVEGAVAEAVAWDWLRCRADSVDLVEQRWSKTPDFVCTKEGQTYFVEVTNISLERMTRLCGFEHGDHSSGFRMVPQPDRGLQAEIIGKVKQGLNTSAPYVVFVTTLHDHGSRRMQDELVIEWVLTSRPAIGFEVDLEGTNMGGESYEFVDFDRAAFVQSQSTIAARRTVSAAVFGPFAMVGDLMRQRRWIAQGLLKPADPRRPRIPDLELRGILHPDAMHPFPPGILEDVNFCAFRSWPPKKTVDVHWTRAAR